MAPNPRLPFENAYWVVPGQLMAGEFPGSKDQHEAYRKIHGLLRCGIRSFLNLMEPGELDFYGKMFSPYEPIVDLVAQELGVTASCAQFPVRDMDVPDLKRMNAILGHIEWMQASERPVYVHCLAGLGRTGTVIGCWLIRHGLATRETVLDKIQILRRGAGNAGQASPQSKIQRQMLTNWPE